MRLIDIDEHFRINKPFYDADIEMPLHRVKIVLEYAPTVEAIPIEWVKRYASEKSANDEMDCYWHFLEEDVLKMIDAWRKENESNT